MSVIDLNKIVKVDNAKDVKIGDKTVPIVFNDEFDKKITALGVRVNQIIDKYSSDAMADKLDGMTKGQQQKEITKFFDDMHGEVIAAVDSVLGDGIGEELYKQYNNSTTAVATVLTALEYEAKKAIQTEENKNRAQRRAKYNKER